jgi:hypothetical protein
MEKVYLLFCLLAITVSSYSQSAKPGFRVVISTVSVSGEDDSSQRERFDTGEAVKLKVEITNLADNRPPVPKGVDYSRPTPLPHGQ